MTENFRLFDDYQDEAHDYAVYPAYGVVNPYPFLGLAEEAGEVAGKLKRLLRGDYSPEEYRRVLRKELGDVLWYVAEICTDNGWLLSDVASENLGKLHARTESGMIKGSGDDRELPP